jgi:hypothetical protein
MGLGRAHECGREGIVAVCRRWCENVVSTGVVDLVEVVRLGVEAMIGVPDIASRRQRNTCQRCQRELVEVRADSFGIYGVLPRLGGIMSFSGRMEKCRHTVPWTEPFRCLGVLAAVGAFAGQEAVLSTPTGVRRPGRTAVRCFCVLHSRFSCFVRR